MKKLLIIAVLAVAGVAHAGVFPDRTLESTASTTGQNVRIASGANASGEYGVVAGSNANAADATVLFAVCEQCDDYTGSTSNATYVFSVSAAGNWTLDATAPLITTASSAAGLNLGIASGANAAGEYGVVVGTTSTAVITGQGLFAVAADVDGTPVYSLEVQPISVLGVGAQVLNTSSVAALNLAIYSGANLAGEYAVSVGTSAAVTDTTQLLGVCQDCDGTEAYVFTVSADDNVLLGATAPIVSTVSTQAGINLVLASGADAAGEYGVSLGTNAAAAASLDLVAFGVDLDGTPIYALTVTTVAAGGTGAWVYNTASAAAQNLTMFSGANAAGEYAVEVGTSAIVSDGTQLFAVGSDLDGTEDYVFTVSANGTVDVENAATGGVILNFRDYADTADDDMAHAVLTTNCTATGTGAENCDFTVGVVEAGAAAETRLNIDADAGVTIGSANTNSITLSADGTADADLVLPLTSVSGAEMVNDTVDGAQLADTIDLDADLTWTVGGGEQIVWNKAVTDATADEGLQLNYTALDTTSGTLLQYALSVTNVASTEAADALIELDNADADDNVAAAIYVSNAARFTTHFTVGNAAAVFGDATVDSWTFTADGAANADFVVPNESIAAAEIENPVRSISLSLYAAANCTASEILTWAAAADTKPGWVLISSAGPALAYDATGGSVDTDEGCLTFTVPQDWVSGGTFIFRMTQAAATVTNLESIEVRISIDGAALGAADEDNLANQTAVQSVTSAPAGTQAAGASVSVMFKQGNAAADDLVNILGIDYQYVASM